MKMETINQMQAEGRMKYCQNCSKYDRKEKKCIIKDTFTARKNTCPLWEVKPNLNERKYEAK